MQVSLSPQHGPLPFFFEEELEEGGVSEELLLSDQELLDLLELLELLELVEDE